MSRAGALMAGLLSISAACEASHGIVRHAQLRELPDLACVRRVVAAMPSVTNVEESHSKRPSGASTGFVAEHHTYFFDVEDHRAQMTISVPSLGRVDYRQHMVRVNRRYPNEVLRAARQTMIAIERALESRCGVENLSEVVVERCLGFECPAPPDTR